MKEQLIPGMRREVVTHRWFEDLNFNDVTI